jgi:hypothetical protein
MEMSKRLASRARSVGRRIVYGYAAAGVVLLAVLALRVDAVTAWFWGALLVLASLAVSLRSALVYAHRKKPSSLNWWIRPTAGEDEFAATWLVYAVFFGAAPVVVFFL